MSGRRCCDEIDRRCAVMAERKADLTVVVRENRRRLAGHRARQDGGRAVRRERERMVVPTEQRGLEEDRKNADKGGAAPPYGRP